MGFRLTVVALVSLASISYSQSAELGRYPTGVTPTDLESFAHANMLVSRAFCYLVGLTQETGSGLYGLGLEKGISSFSQFTGMSRPEIWAEKVMRETTREALKNHYVRMNEYDIAVTYNNHMVAYEQKVVNDDMKNVSWLDRLLENQIAKTLELNTQYLHKYEADLKDAAKNLADEKKIVKNTSQKLGEPFGAFVHPEWFAKD